MAADEFPLQQLDLGGQRHVAQASREPVHAGQELAGQVGPRVGLLLDSLSEVGRHASPLLIFCAALAVVVTGPIIPPRPQGVNRRVRDRGPRNAGREKRTQASFKCRSVEPDGGCHPVRPGRRAVVAGGVIRNRDAGSGPKPGRVRNRDAARSDGPAQSR